MQLLTYYKSQTRVSEIFGDLEHIMSVYGNAGNSLTQEQLEDITTVIATVREKITTK
ncbi:MAG: hypothetical protein HC896_02875 [Bacteroidales bacterium]|nr:hypothetical protein [Bacteroidales bacterium]